MSTYRTGTIDLTNGSDAVVGDGTAFLSEVDVGNWLTRDGDVVAYQVDSIVDDTHLTLAANYNGVTGTALNYEINRDKTSLGIPLVQRGDLYPWGVLGQAFQIVNALIIGLTGGPYVKQAYSALLTSISSLAVVAGDLIIGSAADAVSRLAAGANGQILSLVSGLPAWVNALVCAPQGRLTFTSGVPVLTADVTGATTVYYTPYVGDRVPIFDGTRFVMKVFTETSQALSDATKSPAATAADKLYDYFVWDDAGTIRCTRGPLWDSDTSRGTGAGKSELQKVQGFYTNKYAIANGPGAGLGTYVGTFRTNGSNQGVMLFRPAAAAGGTANKLYLWNAYNRRPVVALCRESADNWTYTTATLRSMNNSVANAIDYVAGLAEGFFEARHSVTSSSSSGQPRVASIGYDATNATADGCRPDYTTGAAGILVKQNATLERAVDIGRHTINALEYSTASGTTTWYGDSGGPSVLQSGLSLKLEM